MTLRVRYVECDMQGRVFNGHYLTYVDMASTEALGRIVGSYQDLLSAGVDYVVVAAELQFRRPATFDDELVIQVRFEPPGNTSLRSEYVIARNDDLIAECSLVHVCVDAATFEKRQWPQWVRDRLPAT